MDKQMPVNRDLNDYAAVVSWYNELLGIITAMNNDDSLALPDIQESLTKLAGKMHQDIKETIVA